MLSPVSCLQEKIFSLKERDFFVSLRFLALRFLKPVQLPTAKPPCFLMCFGCCIVTGGETTHKDNLMTEGRPVCDRLCLHYLSQIRLATRGQLALSSILTKKMVQVSSS